MLQQTQVNRVKEEFYPQFLTQFPTLKSVGDAPLEDVLAAWSGLGYYSRARNLHQTAKHSQGKLPRSFQELLALPGIGEYTASAICSFGYNEAMSVIDTNIARVLKRYFALLNGKAKELRTYADKLLNAQQPRSHNLALMDLGSMVCLPNNPKCEVCPLQKDCLGKEEAHLYTQKKKTAYESLELFHGIYIKNGKIALTPTTGSMYKNMLSLPSVDPIEENFLGSFRHSYTKYRLHVKLYSIQSCDNPVWIDLHALDTAPVSSLTKKALATVLK